MALDNLQVDYLIDPAFQIENLAGKPAVGGHIEVFEAGTDTKVITYQDFDGTENPFKIPLHSDGRAVILADPSKSYDVYVYDSFNNLMFSRLNVTPNLSGNINITGSDVVIYNTDGTLDITQQSIQNNVRRYEINTKHKSFGVQEPLYFIEDSDSATIIGCRSQSGEYATTAYVESAIISAYSSQSGNFLTDKFEYDNNNHITAYNNSAFAGTEYEAGDNIDITNHIISVTGLPTDSDIENAISSAVTNVENKFEYNDNNYITAYNNSAFAGKEYSAGDYVRIENDTINVTGLQPSGDYATKIELESATSGKMDVTGMTAYQPTGDYATHDDLTAYQTIEGMTAYQPSGDYATHDDLTAYQPVGDYYSASNPSGFITNDAITGLQPSGDYVTHDEMTGYQPVGDYYSASNPSGFITNDAITGLQPSGDYVTHDEMTAYQPTGDYATHDDLTAYATTALVSSVSATLYSAVSSISGDYELVAGAGVELVDDPNAKTTTINVTAEGTPVTAIQMMIESATSGLQPSGDYATTAQLADKLDTTAFSTVSGDFLTAHQDISDLMPKSESANFYPMTGNPSGFLTAHQDLSNYATTAEVADKLDTTAFSDVSGSFLTAHQSLDGYATTEDVESAVSSKLDTTAFSTVSGNFLTAHQDLSDYATTAELAGKQDAGDYLSATESANFYPMTGNPSGFLTDVPAGTMNESAFGYDASNNITAYNGSAFAGQGSVTGNYVSGVNVVTSAHEYIPESYTITATTVSGDVVVTTAEVMFGTSSNTAAYSLTSIGNAVNSKLDSNYVTDSTTIKNINNHAEMMGSAYRLGGFNTISANEVSVSPYFSYVQFDGRPHNLYSGVIIVETTAVGDIPDSWTLQSFENNSAVLVKQYQVGTTGDYIMFSYSWNAITNCEASATTYSGFELAQLAFKDEVPSGSEVPSGVMSESGLEFNAVNEISGYNGSAIAQYGAEKQWLTHDDTIVHVSNSAQYAFGVNLSGISADLARMMGLDETVLWSGTFTNESSGMPLIEAADNFEKLKFIHYWNGNSTWVNWTETTIPVTDDNITLSNITQINNGDGVYFSTNVIKFDTTAHDKFVHIAGYRNTFKNENPSTTDITHITKIIGIGRKN